MSESAGTRLVNTPDEVKGGGLSLSGGTGIGLHCRRNISSN